jgi:hypothetical protein
MRLNDAAGVLLAAHLGDSANPAALKILDCSRNCFTDAAADRLAGVIMVRPKTARPTRGSALCPPNACAERALCGCSDRVQLQRRRPEQTPPPPFLPYKVDTSRPSCRTNWTRRMTQASRKALGAGGQDAGCGRLTVLNISENLASAAGCGRVQAAALAAGAAAPPLAVVVDRQRSPPLPGAPPAGEPAAGASPRKGARRKHSSAGLSDVPSSLTTVAAVSLPPPPPSLPPVQSGHVSSIPPY